MNIVEGKSLEELASNAIKICKDGVKTNLILRGEFLYDEVTSSFIQSYIDKANMWQDKLRPKELHINHGEFIHRNGLNGIDYIIQQLKNKPDGNRACVSLVDVEDIVKSDNDSPLPSFMILQFGFENMSYKKILAAAYFRALEVSRFLPVNLAEICNIIKCIRNSIPAIETFELNIYAFRAHYTENFNCLEKAELDIVDKIEITMAVCNKDLALIRKWLNSKYLDEASIICTEGLEELYKSLVLFNDKNGTDPKKYDKIFVEHVEKALNSMKDLKEMRKSTSHSSGISSTSKNIRKELEKAIKVLDNIINGF